MTIAVPIAGIATSWATIAVGITAATYTFLWALLHLTQDAKEPPLAPCAIPIPFIGPIIEMRMKKSGFPLYMKAKFPSPIYTVRVPGRRFYFINSKALIPAVQRQHRTLSFDPPLLQGLRSILGVGQTTLDIIGRDVFAGSDHSFLIRLNKTVHPHLMQGPALESMNYTAMRILEQSLSDLVAKGPARVKIYDWLRRTAITAITESVYGPGNPFRDAENLEAWIRFDTVDMPVLALDMYPEWAIAENTQARTKLIKAFDHYLAQESYKSASEFTQARINFYLKEGVPASDISKLSVADNIAFSSNLVPTLFWLLYHIFSDPSTLSAIRTEVAQAVRPTKAGAHTVSLERLKASCPLLQSTLKEVFRFHGFGLVPRRALEYHMLDGTYLIKKEGTVFMPYRVQHHDPNNWGDDHDEFHARRFLKDGGAGVKRHDPAALRGFGNGAHLCPGRHFASADLLLFTTMMVLRFDLTPAAAGAGDGGKWPRPTTRKSSQVAAVDQPDDDFEVVVAPRMVVSQEGWTVDLAATSGGLGVGLGDSLAGME